MSGPESPLTQIQLTVRQTQDDRFIEVSHCRPGEVLQIYLRNVAGYEAGPVTVAVTDAGMALIPVGTIPPDSGYHLRVSSPETGLWCTVHL